jgi:hypothetical protein
VIDEELLEGVKREVLVTWAADCAERVLPIFEAEAPGDERPREAIEAAGAGYSAAAAESRKKPTAPPTSPAAMPTSTPLPAAAAGDAASSAACDAAYAASEASSAARYAASATTAAEEAWQERRLVELLWPELSKQELEVAAALLPEW